jgi:5-(carboxyamino)imidazole ribonucleotide synthase
MVNLLGRIPPAPPILATGAHLHLYGKAPHPGRKVGHVTLCAHDADTVETRLAEVLALTS